MINTLPEVGYTLLEASKIIGCHSKHLYKIVNRGDLQPFLGLDNRLRISKEELYSYLKGKEAASR
jgi:hypothetical protein